MSKLILFTEKELKEAENYFFKKATLKVKKFAKPSQHETISTEANGILYYNRRILSTGGISAACEMTAVMKDLASTTFYVPVIYRHLAYSIINEIHWHSNVAMHSGIETIWRYLLKDCFILCGQEIVKKIKIHCERCLYLHKRTIHVEMGPISSYNMKIAPAFYGTQVDICGPQKAYSPHKRTTIKIWLVVFCCMATSATPINVMVDYSTIAFEQAFIRSACEVGYPQFMLIDEGSQLVKGCESMPLTFADIKNKLHRDTVVNFDTCPVGGHNYNGKIETRIRHTRESLEKNCQNERLSILQWETVSPEIANAINDLPLALGNIFSDYENMDLLTPNRLKLGRNNERSPIGPISITGNLSDILKTNKKIFNTWFETWLVNHVPMLMHQPKWFQSDRDINVCDIVLFIRHESTITSKYQYGMIHEVLPSQDGIIRKVVVKYRNNQEIVDRFASCAARELVLIHPVDELHLCCLHEAKST